METGQGGGIFTPSGSGVDSTNSQSNEGQQNTNNQPVFSSGLADAAAAHANNGIEYGDQSHPFYAHHPTKTYSSSQGDIILNHGTTNSQKKGINKQLLIIGAIAAAVIAIIIGVVVALGTEKKSTTGSASAKTAFADFAKYIQEVPEKYAENADDIMTDTTDSDPNDGIYDGTLPTPLNQWFIFAILDNSNHFFSEVDRQLYANELLQKYNDAVNALRASRTTDQELLDESYYLTYLVYNNLNLEKYQSMLLRNLDSRRAIDALGELVVNTDTNYGIVNDTNTSFLEYIDKYFELIKNTQDTDCLDGDTFSEACAISYYAEDDDMTGYENFSQIYEDFNDTAIQYSQNFSQSRFRFYRAISDLIIGANQ